MSKNTDRFDVNKFSADRSKFYLSENDLDHREELNDLHKDEIKEIKLSKYCWKAANKQNILTGGVKNLYRALKIKSMCCLLQKLHFHLQ